MDSTVRKLVGQAVVQYLDGNIALFNRWVQQAVTEYNHQQKQRGLHATVQEILESKGFAL